MMEYFGSDGPRNASITPDDDDDDDDDDNDDDDEHGVQFFFEI